MLGREGQFEGASAGGRAAAGRGGAEPSRGGAGVRRARRALEWFRIGERFGVRATYGRGDKSR